MALINPDDKPLELDGACAFAHRTLGQQNAEAGLMVSGVGGAGWKRCPYCHQQCEPKMATGSPTGPRFGPGRGWVTLRMQRRWEAIAIRFKGQFG